MNPKMKKGTVFVESGKPLRFEASDESDAPPTPEQANANLIADALKAYCKSARDLVAGKFAYLAEVAPRHLRLVSVAKGKIVRRNLHFRRFSGQVLLASKKRDVSHLRDDSLHRTACLCRPLLDGQRSVRPAAGVFQLAELSRGAAGNAADELCGSRTAAAGRAA